MGTDPSIDILSPDQPLMFQAIYNTFLSVPQLSDPVTATTEGISLTLRYSQPGEPSFGAEQQTAICVAMSREYPSAQIREAFAGFLERRIPSDSVIPLEDRMKVGEDFYVKDNWGIVIDWLPHWLKQYIDGITNKLYQATTRAVRIARWRLALSASHRPIRSASGSRWSYDGVTWHLVPSNIYARMEMIPTNVFPPSMLKDIGRLLEETPSVTEPLGHELLREAWNQRHDNPRSALVLGIASAEARVKEFIGRVEPGAIWLVENVTSPPLPAMLKNYVPELLVRHDIRPQLLPPPNNPIMQQIDKGIGLRNKVAHGIDRDIHFDTVNELLLTIRDIQSMFDVFSGQDWARDFVRPEVLARWDP